MSIRHTLAYACDIVVCFDIFMFFCVLNVMLVGTVCRYKQRVETTSS
jgi:hypothetical protein